MNINIKETIGNNDSDGAILGPGSMLRVAREEANLSIKAVASKLHLDRGVIEAIEDDDYSRFEGQSIFLRGYLRAYAKLVRLNADKVMQAFEALRVPDKLPEKPQWVSKRSAGKPMSMRFVTYGIVIMMSALVALWWRSQKTQEFETVQETLVPTTAEMRSPLENKQAIRPAVTVTPLPHTFKRKPKQASATIKKPEATEASTASATSASRATNGAVPTTAAAAATAGAAAAVTRRRVNRRRVYRQRYQRRPSRRQYQRRRREQRPFRF